MHLETLYLSLLNRLVRTSESTHEEVGYKLTGSSWTK